MLLQFIFQKKGTSMSKQIALTFILLFSLASLRAMDAPEKNINLDILTEGKAIELIDLTPAELQSEYPGIHQIIQQNFPNSADLFSEMWLTFLFTNNIQASGLCCYGKLIIEKISQWSQ